MGSEPELLKFRCTGCGNCCRDPFLPLTDADVRRIRAHTGERSANVVQFVDRNEIEMDDEPEAFAILRQGKRVMILRHSAKGCRYLALDDRCSIYQARPLGCRIFPFDPTFDRQGKLRRLELIQATECEYTLDGANDPSELRNLHQSHERDTLRYHQKIAEWNQLQRRRKRLGRKAQTAAQFLAFLGLDSS